ncbi:helix-turn-helix domain-containing protein [Crenobacter sedimenti]|uniref:Helix-turn-helix domain-containing protein n=1 Tax=Crenobacter caeni TaxID=2705474 RepID=A0A6B2KNS7_9NEIS|nr:helix-turn-helix domain-containing protein [Crenobacter caeni]
MSTALLTPAELAEMLGLSVQTIYNLRSNGGALPPAIVVGRRVRYQLSDVEAWLQGQYEHTPALQEAKAPHQAGPVKRGRPSKEEAIRRRLRANNPDRSFPLNGAPLGSEFPHES